MSAMHILKVADGSFFPVQRPFSGLSRGHHQRNLVTESKRMARGTTWSSSCDRAANVPLASPRLQFRHAVGQFSASNMYSDEPMRNRVVAVAPFGLARRYSVTWPSISDWFGESGVNWDQFAFRDLRHGKTP